MSCLLLTPISLSHMVPLEDKQHLNLTGVLAVLLACVSCSQ